MRIYFRDSSLRLSFFEEVRSALKLRTWREFGHFYKTSRSMIDSYRKGELCIPEKKFNIFLNSLPLERKEYFKKYVGKKEDNWGRILGGREAYMLNKDKFILGRKKGARFRSRFGLKYNFDINMPLSEDLCEFIGVIIGDGFTNRYGRMCQTQITGDKILDLKYYSEVLRPMLFKLFNIPIKITNRKDCIQINLYSRRLFEMLTIRFNIPAGLKCYSVVIPEEIIHTGYPFLNAVLRGMFNTDGGVGFDRRKSYKKPYVRVNYTSASPRLIGQIHKFLSDEDIPHSINKRNNTQLVQINGETNVRKFLKNVGFSNPRSLDKVRYLIS